MSFAAGGMERAGATSTGRVGATCRVGIGEGIGCDRACLADACALRAGVVARARLTAAFLWCFTEALGFLRLDRLGE